MPFMDRVTLYSALFILYSIWGENMKVAEFNWSKINIHCFHLVPSFQSIHYLCFKAAFGLFPAVAPKACWVFLHLKQLAMFADGKPVRILPFVLHWGCLMVGQNTCTNGG